MRCEDNMK